MPACKATNTDDSACLKDRLRRLISFVRSEEGRRTPPAQGRAPMTAALVESLRRSAGADPSPRGAVKLPLYKQFQRSRRERERVPLLPAAEGTEQKTGGLPQSRPRTQHHCPAVAIWVFSAAHSGQLQHGLRAQLRPLSGRLPSILRVFPAVF